MKTLLTLIVITTYQGLLFGQSEFNKSSYTSIDFSYFKYTSRNDRFYRRTNFFSSELQFKSNRHYLLGGININPIFKPYSNLEYCT